MQMSTDNNTPIVFFSFLKTIVSKQSTVCINLHCPIIQETI